MMGAPHAAMHVVVAGGRGWMTHVAHAHISLGGANWGGVLAAAISSAVNFAHAHYSRTFFGRTCVISQNLPLSGCHVSRATRAPTPVDGSCRSRALTARPCMGAWGCMVRVSDYAASAAPVATVACTWQLRGVTHACAWRRPPGWPPCLLRALLQLRPPPTSVSLSPRALRTPVRAAPMCV